jgi:hypothetical protein
VSRAEEELGAARSGGEHPVERAVSSLLATLPGPLLVK